MPRVRKGSPAASRRRDRSSADGVGAAGAALAGGAATSDGGVCVALDRADVLASVPGLVVVGGTAVDVNASTGIVTWSVWLDPPAWPLPPNCIESILYRRPDDRTFSPCTTVRAASRRAKFMTPK